MTQQKKIILFLTFVFFLSFVHSSLAQQLAQATIDEATRETDHSRRNEVEKKIQTPPKETPPKIEKEQQPTGPIKFSVKEIKLTGVESFSMEDFRPILQKYENKEMTFDDLNLLTKDVETEYLKRGIIAAVFIPPQVMSQGVVTLQVVEAKMGQLHIPKHKYFKESRLKYYWTIKKGEVIHYKDILKSLQLMNKNPDRKVTSTLHAGEEAQTTDVTLKVDTTFPLHVVSSFDKEGVTSTGINRYGDGGRYNNLLGFDDTFLAGTLFGNAFDSWYAYHSIPISNSGTTLFYGHSFSESSPKKEFSSIGLNSQARTSSVFLKQDLFKEGKIIGEVDLGFEAKEKTTKRDTGTINRDRLRIARLNTLIIKEGATSVTYFQPQVSQGLYAFGARKVDELSSRLAKPIFTKFNFDVQHKRALPWNLQAVFQLKTQIASSRLTPQEQFDLGGLNSIRGYPSSDFLADDGVKTNFEILTPAVFIPKNLRIPFTQKKVRDYVTLVTFLDYGWGNKRNIVNAEKDTANFLSAGGGIRIRLLPKMLLRMEWGFPIGDKTITETGKSRFHISVDFES